MLLTAAVALVLVGIGWMAVFQIVGDDSKKGLIIAVGLVAAPVMAYLALRRPIVFPFALYAALIPFDNLLKTGSGSTLTRILGAFAALALVIQLLLKKDAVKPSRSALLWGLLIAWMGVTVFWALDNDAAISDLTRSLQLYLLFAVVAIYPIRSSDYKLLLGAVIGGGACAALYGDYLYHSGLGVAAQRLFMRGLDDPNSQVDPNHFAASLIVPVALATMTFLRCKLSLGKFLLLGIVAICLTAFVISGSRGGILAVAAMMLFFFVRSPYRLQLALGAIGAALLIAPTNLIARFQIATSTGGAGRIDIWRNGLAAFKDHWLVGAGTGNFAFATDQIFLKVPHADYVRWHRPAHDVIVQFSVELGIIGVFLLIAAWFFQFRELDSIGKTSGLYDLRIALQGAVLGLFVASLFLGTMGYKYTWLLFGLMVLTRNLTIVESVGQERKLSRQIGGPGPMRRITGVSL